MSPGVDVVGTWWLPGAGRNRIEGRLTYTVSDGGHLELDGNLQHVLNPSTAAVTVESGERADTYPRIVGANDRGSYTLLDFFSVSSSRPHLGRGGTERIRVGSVIKGIELNPAEPIMFDGCIAELRHLTPWVAQTGLETETQYLDPNYDGDHLITVTAKRVERQDVNLSNDLGLALSHRLSVDGDRVNFAGVRQRFVVKLSFGSMTELDEIVNSVSDLQDLISLGCRRPAQIEILRLLHPDAHVRTMDGTTHDAREPLEYLNRWLVRDPTPDEPQLRWHDMLFSLADVGGIEAVGRWMNLVHRHRSALGRVMATSYAREMFVQDKISNCTAALESLATKIVNDSAKDLAIQLRRCGETAGKPFTALVGDVETWAALVTRHRHDIAHHHDRYLVSSVAEQAFLAQSLYWLFVLCLFRLAEFSEVVFDRIADDSNYAWLGIQVRRIVESRRPEIQTRNQQQAPNPESRRGRRRQKRQDNQRSDPS